MTMGYAAGLAMFIDANLYPLVIFVLICITSVDVAILGMFFCRLQIIIPSSHILKLKTKGYVLLMASLYIVFPGSILLTGIITYTSVVGTKDSFEEQFTCASAVMSYVTNAFDYWTLSPLVLNISMLTIIYTFLAIVLATKSFSTIKKVMLMLFT
ncbi:hypothetical protein Y032_0180g805 [Ancylostoma ceylanicum]|nr:hypothetical protein Y032_0180g805 [Ancylostoma ceylanicum]